MASDELKDEFLYELWEALKEAGLHPDPDSIIGHKYVFKCCDNGPIVCGTITAIGTPNLIGAWRISVGLELYVSNSEVYDEKIRRIVKNSDGWAIEVNKETADRFLYGELRLFFDPIPHAPDAYNNRIFKA